ncbi:protein translocase subunit SecDF [Ornithinibacillus halotolerans]|uniref:Multifunctional fusion protein n=1 Tax=Ornithinibacillus halotolerans TaxID=1274357 RepID=A0A916RV97_9BACI|nr:protein translocase subunit SecDF [Ornithinibacillus halotolerans]GGA69229.1 protein translocase subunit SecDF [Ornithinibacillus halotolerans]
MKNKGRIVSFFLIVIALGVVIGLFTPKVAKDINLGLDLQGGFEVLYEVEPVDKTQTTDRELLESTVQLLNDRVNKLGISEAVIDIEGENRIRVQLAGVEDQNQAREMLATSARLSFRDVHDNVLLDGADIKEGSAKQDFHPDTNAPIVTLQVKEASKLTEVTTELSQKFVRGVPLPEREDLLVIWMDYQEGDSFKEEVFKEEPKYISAPGVEKPIPGTDVMISGSFTVEEAKYLANIINSGSLPVDMTEIFSTSVGAQFGEQALNETVIAAIVGIAIIFLFMIVVYRFPGIISIISLSIYTFLVLLIFELLNGVLTLPGIAALILGVGMAVDANVITFERIKEELREGKSLHASFKAGTSNSLRAILDANITTMLAATVLFIFGTSSVKGFATMLIISILVSFLTAVFGTKWLLQLWLKAKFLKKNPSWFGVKQSDVKDIKDNSEVPAKFLNKEWNIVDYRRRFFIFTSILVIIGAVSLIIFKLNPGIDFTSGSRVQIVAEESLDSEKISKELAQFDLDAPVVLSGENNEIAVIRYEEIIDEDRIAELNTYFIEEYGVEPSVSVVSSIVGQELVKNAIYALAIASIGMIIYVAFRFEFFFAITTIIALLHDVFIMLMVFSIFRIEFDVTIVAAILTIIGYSINATIVTFDRIRENIQKQKKPVKLFKDLATIVNKSIVQTMTRTVNTTITTLIAVLAFLFLGAEPIQGFGIALTVGLIAGTYSSLFLATQLWLVWRGKNIKEKPVDFRKKKRIEGPQV